MWKSPLSCISLTQIASFLLYNLFFPRISTAIEISSQQYLLEKKHPKILAWTNDLVNYFWRSCNSCEGNSDLLLELFHSSLFHVLNIHSWPRRAALKATFAEMRGTKPYPEALTLAARNQKCHHAPLTKSKHRKGKWFKVHEADFMELFKILSDTKRHETLR